MAMKWTDELKEELIGCEGPEAIRAFADKHGLPNVESVARKRREFIAVTQGENSKVRFLTKKSRTIKELINKGFDPNDLEVEGYELYQTRNSHYESVFRLIPDIEKVPLQKKRWKYSWGSDAEGNWQPYLWIQMPRMRVKKLKVVPLADVHYGAHNCNIKKLREYIDWIDSRDDVFACIVGDLFENSHGDSNKGVSVYEQDVRPRSQVEEMYELLSPIAHKILWAIPGNHEARSRTRDYDPLEHLCQKLEIPFSREPVFVDVLWNGYTFTFHCKHGRSASRKEGGKLNAAIESLHMQEHVMFEISAHVHDAIVKKKERICRNRVDFSLEFKKQYVIICPAFLSYFGSYASEGGWEPGAMGTINCELFSNGDFHAGA